MSVPRRIATLEGQIQGMIDEIASLKIQIGDSNEPLYPSLFDPIPCVAAPPGAVELKEVFVLLDFETGGLGKTDEIRVCQVGAIALDQEMNALGEFNEFCNPRVDIAPGATAVNGITNDFVKHLDGWNKVGLRLNQWISGYSNGLPVTLAAHNGKRFDFRILAFENARYKIPNLPNLYSTDTIQVFKELFKGCNDYKLGTIYQEQFHEKIPDQHTALSDCKAMHRLLGCGDHKLVRDKMFKYRESFDCVLKRCYK
jgi:DNA polymerase III alpha subunit (gram-positive type)